MSLDPWCQPQVGLYSFNLPYSQTQSTQRALWSIVQWILLLTETCGFGPLQDCVLPDFEVIVKLSQDSVVLFFDLLRWCWLRLEHCLPPLPDSRVVYLLVTALPRHLDQMHFYILLEAPFPLGLLVRFGEVEMFWRFQLNASYGILPLPPCSSLYCSAH